ncbi:MAG: YeeE/YedE thiosulfate transporter family protein [Proteobacteria bacterium]|nr:YeeE/YedE thiosulfate transporter family protein [Pseudomonadota bacterium]
MLPTIDWSHFTPMTSFMGGAMIGMAASILIIVKGRVAGISGILGSMMQLKNTPVDHFMWRALFVSGILLSSVVYGLFFPLPESIINSSYITLVGAGLLVGFGTRMGSGCTSGHAVCGIARLSLRSLVATLTFMGSGFLTAYLLFHVL